MNSSLRCKDTGGVRSSAACGFVLFFLSVVCALIGRENWSQQLLLGALSFGLAAIHFAITFICAKCHLGVGRWDEFCKHCGSSLKREDEEEANRG